MTNTNRYAGKPALSLSGLYRWLYRFFIAYLIGEAVLIVASLLYLSSDLSAYDPEVDLIAADWVLLVGLVPFMIGFLGSVFLFSRFTYRAMKNLHIWGARAADMSAGWAVGWYFIPIANLFKPYQGMDQINDGSAEVAGDPMDETNRLSLWWGAWVLTNILSNVSFRLSRNSAEEGMLKLTNSIDIASSVLGIAAVFAILPVLARITRQQEQRLNGSVFD